MQVTSLKQVQICSFCQYNSFEWIWLSHNLLYSCQYFVYWSFKCNRVSSFNPPLGRNVGWPRPDASLLFTVRRDRAGTYVMRGRPLLFGYLQGRRGFPLPLPATPICCWLAQMGHMNTDKHTGKCEWDDWFQWLPVQTHTALMHHGWSMFCSGTDKYVCESAHSFLFHSCSQPREEPEHKTCSTTE